MCRSINRYDLRVNVINWFWSYLAVAIIHYVAFSLPDYVDILYLSGVGLGILLMWALEMAREWLKTWTFNSNPL